jgi:DNA polymerase-3 subunit alpha
MALHRSRFLSHAIARRIDPVQAKRIIESIEQVASFAFSKSHATAYALLTYQTAWLKAHYREAFSAAVQRESES